MLPLMRVDHLTNQRASLDTSGTDMTAKHGFKGLQISVLGKTAMGAPFWTNSLVVWSIGSH